MSGGASVSTSTYTTTSIKISIFTRDDKQFKRIEKETRVSDAGGNVTITNECTEEILNS